MRIFICALVAGGLCGCSWMPDSAEARAMAARVEVSAGVTKAGDYYYGPLRARIRSEEEMLGLTVPDTSGK